MPLRDVVCAVAVGLILGFTAGHLLSADRMAQLDADHLEDLAYMSDVVEECDSRLRDLEDQSTWLGLVERNVELETEVLVLRAGARSAEADCLLRIARRRKCE